MKYENKEQIYELLRQINQHETNLNARTNEKRTIFVKAEKEGTLFTIDASNNSEHEYKYVAHKLVEEIKQDLIRRIDNLKSMLEQL